MVVQPVDRHLEAIPKNEPVVPGEIVQHGPCLILALPRIFLLCAAFLQIKGKILFTGLAHTTEVKQGVVTFLGLKTFGCDDDHSITELIMPVNLQIVCDYGAVVGAQLHENRFFHGITLNIDDMHWDIQVISWRQLPYLQLLRLLDKCSLFQALLKS